MSAIFGNLVHPIGHSSPTPDVVAPDGSEVRYLVGVENGATKSSVVEVTPVSYTHLTLPTTP